MPDSISLVQKNSRYVEANAVIEDVVSNTSNLEKLSLTSRTAGLVRTIGCTSKKMLDNAKNLPVVGVLKLIGLGLLPLTIYEFATGIFSAFKSSLNEKIDVAFSTIATLGSIGDVIADTAEGLSAVGAVGASSVAWTTPLAIACAVIQSNSDARDAGLVAVLDAIAVGVGETFLVIRN